MKVKKKEQKKGTRSKIASMNKKFPNNLNSNNKQNLRFRGKLAIKNRVPLSNILVVFPQRQLFSPIMQGSDLTFSPSSQASPPSPTQVLQCTICSSAIKCIYPICTGMCKKMTSKIFMGFLLDLQLEFLCIKRVRLSTLMTKQ